MNHVSAFVWRSRHRLESNDAPPGIQRFVATAANVFQWRHVARDRYTVDEFRVLQQRGVPASKSMDKSLKHLVRFGIVDDVDGDTIVIVGRAL
jgi:hypothetical protein